MNMTPLDQAFDYSTPLTTRQFQLPTYSQTCIYCSNQESISLMNDGGSFRQCLKCRKQFRAQIIVETKKDSAIQKEQRQQAPPKKNEVSAHHPFYLPNPTKPTSL